MPSASETIAIAVTNGVLKSVRRASFTEIIARLDEYRTRGVYPPAGILPIILLHAEERSADRRVHPHGAAVRAADPEADPHGGARRLSRGGRDREMEHAGLRVQGAARRDGGVQGALRAGILEGVADEDRPPGPGSRRDGTFRPLRVDRRRAVGSGAGEDGEGGGDAE